MLDARLALAAELYQPCSLGADIGTDHGLLACHLLEQGICEQMYLTDISPKALARAQTEVSRRGLAERARLVCADGLAGLEEPCGCISITGMGGRTIAGILAAGQDRLRGAFLVICAHTEQPEARLALQAVHYRIVREEPCLCNGRAYLLWRAEPGEMTLTPREIRLGREVYASASPMLLPWLEQRLSTLQRRLQGLLLAAFPDREAIRIVREDAAFLESRIEEVRP